MPARGRADAARGAVDRGLLAAARRGQARRDGRDGDGRRGRDERGLPPLARAQRPAAHLRRGGRAVRRAAPAPRRPGASRSRWRARWRGRCASGATRSSSAPGSRPSTSTPTATRPECATRQQTESHRVIEMLMILANEQVAGYLADRKLPTLYRVHERPEPQSVGVPGRAAGEPRHPDAAAAEADDAPAGRRRDRGDLAHRGARVARQAGLQRARAARAQAGVLQPAQPRPRRARQPALLPLHLADPPLPGRGGAPRAAPGARHRRGGHARRTSSRRRA